MAKFYGEIGFFSTVETVLKHRQLKGRRHGTLNEEGQFVKKQVTENINRERDQKLSSEDTNKNAQLESSISNRNRDALALKSQKDSSMLQAQQERDSEIKSHTSSFCRKKR